MVAVLTALWLAFALYDSSLFSWHPLLMSVGFVLLMTQGLVAAVQFRALDGPPRVAAIQSHALMQLRALLCIAVAFGVIVYNKVRSMA